MLPWIADDLFRALSAREQEVLTLRLGLEDGRRRTLEEVGREFGVTRERARQIEAKALRKLRRIQGARTGKDDREQEPAVSIAADGWVPPPSTPAVPPAGGSPLTVREVQFLCLMRHGRTDQEIAAELGIRMRTVTVSVSRLLNQLRDAGVRSRVDLAGYAIRNGYCTDD